ncbi:MAG: hypothetical protein GC191_16390 [Azospirillum sp.]|nr:hypothetical protein [Azospirillum sp.]
METSSFTIKRYAAARPGCPERRLIAIRFQASLVATEPGAVTQKLAGHKSYETTQRYQRTEPPRDCRRLQLLRGWGHGRQEDNGIVFA